MWLCLPVVAVLATGCWSFGVEVTEVSGDRVTINGVSNDPVGEVVVAGEVETPLGAFVVSTYDSRIGPCYDVRFPDGRSEAGCLAGSGIDPTRPITGRPGDSIEGLNGGWINLGLEDPGAPVGILHHGLAHPTVTTVTVEPDGGEPFGSFPVLAAPNVDGLVVFLAWATPGLDRYTLAAYGADGCLLDADEVALGGSAVDGPGATDPGCDVRVPETLQPPATTAG